MLFGQWHVGCMVIKREVAMSTRKIKRLSDQKGLTLPELIITISIVMILSMIGVASFSSSLPLYRLKAIARDLVSDMRMARQQAATANVSYSIQFLTTTSYTVLGKVVTAPHDISWTMPAVTTLNFQPNGLITGAPVSIVMNDSHGDTKTVIVNAVGRIRIQ
jgi:prepilin-type N-terminal cleavage/methylation domain-containing protein